MNAAAKKFGFPEIKELPKIGIGLWQCDYCGKRTVNKKDIQIDGLKLEVCQDCESMLKEE